MHMLDGTVELSFPIYLNSKNLNKAEIQRTMMK